MKMFANLQKNALEQWEELELGGPKSVSVSPVEFS